MPIRVTRSVETAPLSDERVREAARAALAQGGRPDLDLDVILVDETTLADLHGRFLGKATATDVIAFDLGEDGPPPAAEIYVSVDCAQRVALQRDMDAGRELALYVVHGALHLCGFDDREEADRRTMGAAERDVLAALGYSLEGLDR